MPAVLQEGYARLRLSEVYKGSRGVLPANSTAKHKFLPQTLSLSGVEEILKSSPPHR